MNAQCCFISEKNQKNNDDIIEQLFLLFSSSIFYMHLVIIACSFLIFDRRFRIVTLWCIFEIVFKKIVIEQKANNCDYISKIDDSLDRSILTLYLNLYDKKYFVKFIVWYVLRNSTHFFFLMLCVFETLIWIFNIIITIIVNDFFWQSSTIKLFCQNILFFVFKRSKFLIFVLVDADRLFINCVKVLSCYIT